MESLKTSYLSPSSGELNITVVRDARPFVSVTLDLGIPNFTVFSLKFPMVEAQPQAMSALVAEAVHVLLDEVSAFMLSCNYQEDVIVQIYATVLACYKGLTQEADSNKAHGLAGQDLTIKNFEGTFQLPMAFVNETFEKVVTAATFIQRAPKVRHIELTYEKPNKTTVNDAARVIRQFRNRTLKQQPNPLYVIVYDQTGTARGTIPLSGPNPSAFKNKLLQMQRKGGSQTPDFSDSMNFDTETEMKITSTSGIPKEIVVEGEKYTPEAFISDDMALYAGSNPRMWIVKFPDGRCVKFSERPSLRKLRYNNFPVPNNYGRWRMIPQEVEEEVEPDYRGSTYVQPDGSVPKEGLTPPFAASAANQDPALGQFMKEFYSQTYANPLNSGERVWKDLAAFTCRPFDGTIHVNSIRSFEKSKGVGSEALKFLCALADKHKVKVQLVAKQYGNEGLTTSQLVAWYSRYGFVPKRGDDLLIREPNTMKTADHYGEDGFWAGEGGGASGILPICVKTGSICFAWRSEEVHQGLCWGTIGGAILRGKTPAESAQIELAEEVGYHGSIKLHPAFIFSSGSFKYHNFIGEVTEEFPFHPGGDHSWETDHIEWFALDQVQKMMKDSPSDFHPGVLSLFKNSGDLITKICQRASTNTKGTVPNADTTGTK
jgi:8-oxo-dGTP pyrophosphatase MutT (NUDIX family)